MPKINDPTKLTTETLVAKAIQLKALLAEGEAELKEFAAAIIARGEGKHSDAEGNVITVIAATEPGVKLRSINDEEAAQAREICGADFTKLFTKEVSYVPQPGFSDRVEVLLKGKARTALAELVEETTRGKSAYLIYPRK